MIPIPNSQFASDASVRNHLDDMHISTDQPVNGDCCRRERKCADTIGSGVETGGSVGSMNRGPELLAAPSGATKIKAKYVK